MDEGLSGLFIKAVDLDLFFGFIVGSLDLRVSYLQYADDTIILEDSLVDNFWSIKTIL